LALQHRRPHGVYTAGVDAVVNLFRRYSFQAAEADESERPAKPTQSVDKPAPYGVEAIPGFNPVRLPTGYPKDLQWQFHKNYRRDDQ